MSAKIIKFDQQAADAILRGINTMANAVKVTLGPRGRNVILEKSFGSPVVTKDGVTVAKEIELDDKFENMGAQMLKEVAQKTSDVAGDGTTTATVLAQAIFREGLKMVAAGNSPIELKRGIDAAVEAMSASIEKLSSSFIAARQLSVSLRLKSRMMSGVSAISRTRAKRVYFSVLFISFISKIKSRFKFFAG